MLSDYVILCIFLLAQTASEVRLQPLAQGHFGRVDVCEQRSRNPSAVGLCNHRTTLTPVTQRLCQTAKGIPSVSQ